MDESIAPLPQLLKISKKDAFKQYLAYHEGQTGYARGTYRKKSWLMGVANKVSSRASMYKSQLTRCNKI